MITIAKILTKKALCTYFERNDINHTVSLLKLSANQANDRARQEVALSVISKMLNKDIPVIFSIGASPVLSDGVPMYGTRFLYGSFDYNTNIVSQFQYGNPYNDGIDLHWMTITQLIIDDIDNSIWMKVQSWGEVYYIEFNNWMRYQQGTFADAIIIIVVPLSA